MGFCDGNCGLVVNEFHIFRLVLGFKKMVEILLDLVILVADLVVDGGGWWSCGRSTSFFLYYY
jgi:hypothetical protein